MEADWILERETLAFINLDLIPGHLMTLNVGTIIIYQGLEHQFGVWNSDVSAEKSLKRSSCSNLRANTGQRLFHLLIKSAENQSLPATLPPQNQLTFILWIFSKLQAPQVHRFHKFSIISVPQNFIGSADKHMAFEFCYKLQPDQFYLRPGVTI